MLGYCYSFSLVLTEAAPIHYTLGPHIACFCTSTSYTRSVTHDTLINQSQFSWRCFVLLKLINVCFWWFYVDKSNFNQFWTPSLNNLNRKFYSYMQRQTCSMFFYTPNRFKKCVVSFLPLFYICIISTRNVYSFIILIF